MAPASFPAALLPSSSTVAAQFLAVKRLKEAVRARGIPFDHFKGACLAQELERTFLLEMLLKLLGLPTPKKLIKARL